MNKIIWEDLNIETDITDGIIKEVEPSYIEEEHFDEYDSIDSEEIITSPFGVFKIRDFFNPMGQYNWYMAHVNFNVTRDVADTISNIIGVEKLLILSRYRFLVAFGKVFDEKEIKKSIQKEFDAFPPLSKEALAKMKDISSGLYNKWVIYFIDDDHWHYATDEDYDEKIKQFRLNQKDFGGIILTYED